ncbi:MAG: acyltransferase [Rhodopila sp.]|nr:acyltransferase [Rhodopila sp.]
MEHRKNLALEGLRGLACLNVVLAHYMFTFMPYASRFLYPEGDIIQRYGVEHWLAKPYFSVLYNGTYPVSIFFVMSGWVLTAPFIDGRKGLERAALKRYPRLVLPAATAILFAWVLFKLGLMGTSRALEVGFAGWLRDHYVTNVSLVPDLLFNMFIGAPINGQSEWDTPLWTLRIELVGPILLFSLMALFGARKALAIALAYTAIAVNIFPQNGAAMHLLAFLSGYLLNFMLPTLRRVPVLALGLLAFGLVFGAFDYSSHFAYLLNLPLPDLSPYAWNLGGDRKTLFHTIGGLLTVAGVLAGAPGFGWLAARPMVWLGKVSFSAYLLHWPILCSAGIAVVAWVQKSGLPYPHAVLSGGIVFLIAVYGAAAIFERWVDAPAIRLANRLARPRANAEAPLHLPETFQTRGLTSGGRELPL